MAAVFSIVSKVPSSMRPDPIFVVFAVFPDRVFVFLTGAIIGAIIEACTVAKSVRLVPNIPEFRVSISLSLDL